MGPRRVGGPNPRKSGTPKGGAQKGGAPKGGEPKISRFFFPTIFFLCSLSLGVFSWNFGV